MDLKAKVYQTSTEVLGHPKRRYADWFDENEPTIKLLLENRKKLYTKTLEARCTRSTKIQYIRSKADLQKSLTEMEDQWWLQKAIEIQCLNDAKDSKNLFAALKEVYGPTTGTLVPVASADGSQIHTEKHEIMCRWVEHFRSVLNCTPALKEATIEEEYKEQSAKHWLNHQGWRS